AASARSLGSRSPTVMRPSSSSMRMRSASDCATAVVARHSPSWVPSREVMRPSCRTVDCSARATSASVARPSACASVWNGGVHRIRRLLLPIDALGAADTAARVTQLMLGLFLYGISLALLVRASLGVGPWDVFSLGIANHLPMSYGTATVVVSGVVLLVWI